MPFFSPQTAPAASSSPLGRRICHREGPRVKRRTRSHGSRSCALATPPPPHPTPRSSARSLSIFQRQQPSHTRDYLDQAGNLFLPPGANKAARLLDTKQTAASLPNTPQPVITRKMQHQAQPIISNFSWRKLI